MGNAKAFQNPFFILGLLLNPINEMKPESFVAVSMTIIVGVSFLSILLHYLPHQASSAPLSNVQEDN